MISRPLLRGVDKALDFWDKFQDSVWIGVTAIIIVLVMVTFVFASCAPARSGDQSVKRYIDDDAGVVCWTYVPGGIDCMPISDTGLGR